jgi:hypothetical protein
VFIQCNIRRFIMVIVTGLLANFANADDDTITSTGHWRTAAPQILVPQRQIFRSGARDGLITTPALPSMTLNTGVVPVVTSGDDLSLLLTGGRGGTNLQDRLSHLMQIVPEVPSSFDGPEFDGVRQDLIPCMTSAAAYRDRVLAVAGSDDIESEANSYVSGGAATSYERNCMTRLADVPIAVRQITGVLVTSGVPWCSATIIGADRLLTSRHCFVHPNGTATEAYDRVFPGPESPGLVSFIAIEEHGGRRSFTVNWSGNPPALTPFTALEDWLVLVVRSGRFDHEVRPGAQSVQSQAMPQSVWVVGSNAHLGDLTAGGPPLAFTRASKPKACSIVRVTPSGCIYHTCQTGPATSGAGILALAANGTVTLLGVHKARISEAAGCEATPPFNDVLNLAINITSQQIE